MFDIKILNIYARITGLFFFISGTGKVFDTTAFANLIYNYGLGYAMAAAPLIAIAEVAIGICLLLLVHPKGYSLAAFILLTLFTMAFGYAHFSRGINDCGCFGTLKQSHTSPLLTFIRNGVLLLMSFIVWRKYPASKVIIDLFKKRLIASVLGVSLFIAGFTFTTPYFAEQDKPSHPFQNKSVQSTSLGKYLTTSKDSTYLVFCFSYTCSHCWNSIENLKNYQKYGAADRVISLATGYSGDKLFFQQNFQPDFFIRDLAPTEMKELTNEYPTAFYIKNDSIKIIIPSELPSPITFKKEYFISHSNTQ